MTSTATDSCDHADGASLPYLARLARLPAVSDGVRGEGPALLARVRTTLGLARLLDDLDLQAECPTTTFNPDWS